MVITDWRDNSTIYDCPAETMRESVLQAISHSIRLDYAQLDHVDLSCTSIHYAQLNHASLRYANISGTTLKYSGLQNTKLYKADLSYSDLRSCNLRKTHMVYTCLQNTTIKDISFCRALIVDSDARNAEIRFNDFAFATLGRTNLTNASLENNTFTGTDIIDSTLIDGGQDSRGFRFVGTIYDDVLWISAGCRWFSYATAHRHWSSRHSNKPLQTECLTRLHAIKTLALSRGWDVID